MDIVTLRRDSYQSDGTFGVLIYNGKEIAVTCELPWDDNKPDESCIPEHNYPCIPHNSLDHPGTWEVTGVPGRSNILIHSGNMENDTKGCILVGLKYGIINGMDAVLDSKEAMLELRQILPSYFTLEVADGVAQPIKENI